MSLDGATSSEHTLLILLYALDDAFKWICRALKTVFEVFNSHTAESEGGPEPIQRLADCWNSYIGKFSVFEESTTTGRLKSICSSCVQETSNSEKTSAWRLVYVLPELINLRGSLHFHYIHFMYGLQHHLNNSLKRDDKGTPTQRSSEDFVSVSVIY